MRYEKEVAWKFHGDVQLAQSYQNQARVVAGEMLAQTTLNLEQLTRRVWLADNVWCEASWKFGQMEIRITAYTIQGLEGKGCRGFIVDPRDGVHSTYPRYGLCFNKESKQWRKLANPDLKYGYITWVKGNIALSISGDSRYRKTGFGDTVYLNGAILCHTPHTAVGVTQLNGLLVVITVDTGFVLSAYYQNFSSTYANDDVYNESTNPNGWKGYNISTPEFGDGDHVLNSAENNSRR